MRYVKFLPFLAVLAHAAPNSTPDLVLSVHNSNTRSAIVRLAEGQAERMLAGAGISVQWTIGQPLNRGPAELIEAIITDQPDDSFRPGALAYATLGLQSGTRIEIFYNRICAHGRDSEIPQILAHVLVHEITHILEGCNRHSETGIMKAHWDANDWRSLRRSSLPFASEDLRLLHSWSETHSRTLVAAHR
ncbi:MAG TPA: hypothetical protein VGL72_29200 [Bryobacteraceae bacterium]|jgi:hypothetical protein